MLFLVVCNYAHQQLSGRDEFINIGMCPPACASPLLSVGVCASVTESWRDCNWSGNRRRAPEGPMRPLGDRLSSECDTHMQVQRAPR